MITVRCTQKLLRRLSVAPQPDAPPSESLLGDWYANLLHLGGEQLILCASERTLLPVLVTARDGLRFPERLRAGLREVLTALHVEPDVIARELATMGEHTFAKTNNRRVLGSMNDLAWMLECGRRDDAKPQSLLYWSLELAKNPCSPLQMNSPDRAAVALLSGSAGGLLH